MKRATVVPGMGNENPDSFSRFAHNAKKQLEGQSGILRRDTHGSNAGKKAHHTQMLLSDPRQTLELEVCGMLARVGVNFLRWVFRTSVRTHARTNSRLAVGTNAQALTSFFYQNKCPTTWSERMPDHIRTRQA